MKIIPYDRKYKRDQFSCGKSSLDQYILRNVSKDVQAGACTCFVTVDDHDRVLAYYTLSADNIPIEGAPESIRKLIRYPYVPVILLGRLAVDGSVKGLGYGKIMLADALKRSLGVAEEHIGSVAVVVDPIDEDAEKFYAKFGFTRLPDSGRMFMSIRKIKEAFSIKQ